MIPVGEHDCVTCPRCACTFASVHPACPRCSEANRGARAAEIARLRRWDRTHPDFDLASQVIELRDALAFERDARALERDARTVDFDALVADRERLENTLKLIRQTATTCRGVNSHCALIADFANRALIDDSWNPQP